MKLNIGDLGNDAFRFLDFEVVDPLGLARKPDKYRFAWGENLEYNIVFSIDDDTHEIFGDNVGIDQNIPISILSTTEPSQIEGAAFFCKACGSASATKVEFFLPPRHNINLLFFANSSEIHALVSWKRMIPTGFVGAIRGVG